MYVNISRMIRKISVPLIAGNFARIIKMSTFVKAVKLMQAVFKEV